MNVKIDGDAAEEVDFKEVSQARAMELLKVSVHYQVLFFKDACELCVR